MITRQEAEDLLKANLGNLPLDLWRLLETLVSHGGTPQIVGGWVRNTLARKPANDVDIEVFGLTSEAIFAACEEVCSKVKWQGVTFGVIVAKTNDGESYEITMPRTERRIPGRTDPQGFEVDIDPYMPRDEAALRRDYTINAMSIDPFTGDFFDFFDGLTHLNNRELRPIGTRFSEDPERVIKGARHAAEMGFWLTTLPEKRELATSIADQHKHILQERLFKDWMKIFMADRPGDALVFLREAGWLVNYPEFNHLIGLKQTPIHHGEEDAFEHTVLVCNATPERCRVEGVSGDQEVAVRIAAFLHDIGKPATTEYSEKNGEYDWRSPGHAHVGALMAPAFMDRIMIPDRIQKMVIPLIECHMDHLDFKGRQINRAAVQEEAVKLYPATHRMLKALVDADHLGRGAKSEIADSCTFLYDVACQAGVMDSPPSSLITGADIMLYYEGKAGAHVKYWKDLAYKAQITDKFSDRESALRWLDAQVAKELRFIKSADFVVDLFGGKSGKFIQDVMDELWSAQLRGDVKTEDDAKEMAKRIVESMRKGA